MIDRKATVGGKRKNGYRFAGVEAWAWIGDKSYIDHDSPSLSQMIYDTKSQAKKAEWKKPSRVKVLLMEKNYG